MTIDLDDNTTTSSVTMAFQLKGGMFTLTTLQIFSSDLLALKQQLLEKIQQAPNFFHNAPMVLELKINQELEEKLDFAKLKSLFHELRLVPVGIKNATPEQAIEATMHGFAILRDASISKEKEKLEPQPAPTIIKNIPTKIITTPVRSGQQVYAPDGDLIVINQVSPGAELIADGSIHVYGPLRGRAIAGINGNLNARIFCNSLEAELVSVAGHFKVSEDIERLAWKIPAQIFIKQDRLQIIKL